MFLKKQGGGSLLESLIALVILSFAVIGLIGLQSNLLRLGVQAQYRLQASMLGQNLAGMMSVDGANAGCYGLVTASALPCTSATAQAQAQAWRLEVLAMLPNAAEPIVAVAADRTATVTLSWTSPKDPAVRNQTLVIQPTL